MVSAGWAGTCFHSIGAPGLVRSSAYTVLGKAECTYITLPITRGLPSCPRSAPVENVQAGTSLPTLDGLIWSSGLNRCRSKVRPVMVHSPFESAAALDARPTITATRDAHARQRRISLTIVIFHSPLFFVCEFLRLPASQRGRPDQLTSPWGLRTNFLLAPLSKSL